MPCAPGASLGAKYCSAGSPSRTLFIVNFGLFDVRNSDNTQNVAQIGAGQLIGEIGFFAESAEDRLRDCGPRFRVLKISRSAFDELTARFPMLQRAISQSFARRLARLAGIVGGGENAGQKNLCASRPSSGPARAEYCKRLSRDYARSRYLGISRAS